jgi:hypothetical protein
MKERFASDGKDYYIESCFIPSSKFKNVQDNNFYKSMTISDNCMKLLKMQQGDQLKLCSSVGNDPLSTSCL